MLRIWLLRVLLLTILAGMGWAAGSALRARRQPGWTPHSGKLRVLTTIFPLYDIAREVGGDAVEVCNLLPAGVDPHQYALSPSDIDLVSGADVLIANGRGLDNFLSAALRKADAFGRAPVNCSDAALQHLSTDRAQQALEGDPHMWLDPVLARDYAACISGAISKELRKKGNEPAARAVEERAAAYDRKLIALDEEFQQGTKPLKGRAFIAFHGAYGYLSARYGLKMAAVWEPSPGREPGPRDVAGLVDIAKSGHVSVFFSEPGFSPRAIEMIAADSRLPVRPMDPLETAVDFSKTHYVEKMRENLRVLRDALGNGS